MYSGGEGAAGSADDALVKFEWGRRRMAQQALAGAFAVAARGRRFLAGLIFLDNLLQIVLVVVEHFAAHFGRRRCVGEQRNRQRFFEYKLSYAWRRAFLLVVFFVFLVLDNFFGLGALDDFDDRVDAGNCRDCHVCGLYSEDFLWELWGDWSGGESLVGKPFVVHAFGHIEAITKMRRKLYIMRIVADSFEGFCSDASEISSEAECTAVSVSFIPFSLHNHHMNEWAK